MTETNLLQIIKGNWNRMATLTGQRNLTMLEQEELSYRIAVQNSFASTGKIPIDYIRPKGSKRKEG